MTGVVLDAWNGSSSEARLQDFSVDELGLLLGLPEARRVLVSKLLGQSAPHTGAMIALVPSEVDAARLVVEGGEPLGELHLTLRFLGTAADIEPARQAVLTRLVRDIARTLGPVTGELFSMAMFNPDGEAPCVVGIVGGDDVAQAHDLIDRAARLLGGNLPPPHEPFVAHVTLEYTGDPHRVAELVDRTGPITFDRMRVAFGVVATDFPLTGMGVPARAAVGQFRRDDAFEHLHPRDPHGGRFVATMLGFNEMIEEHGLVVDQRELGTSGGGLYVGLHEGGEIVVSSENARRVGEPVSGRNVAASVADDDIEPLSEALHWAADIIDERDEDEEIEDPGGNGLVEFKKLPGGYVVGVSHNLEVIIGWPQADEPDIEGAHFQRDFDEWGVEPDDARELASALEEMRDFDPEVYDTYAAGGAWDVDLWTDWDITVSNDAGETHALTMRNAAAEHLFDELAKLRDAGAAPGSHGLTSSYLLSASPDGSVTIADRWDANHKPLVVIPPGDLQAFMDGLDEALEEAKDAGGAGALDGATDEVLAAEAAAAGQRGHARDFDVNQPRDPGGKDGGRWIDVKPDGPEALHAVKKITGALAKKFGKVTATTDKKGIHLSVPFKGKAVPVSLSWFDVASLGLLGVGGGLGAGVKLGLITAKVAKLLLAVKVAETAIGVAGTVAGRSARDNEHWRDQLRDPGGKGGGEWVDSPGSALKDTLKLAGRIDLEPGETFAGSDKVQTEYGTVRVAATTVDGRPRVRLGIGDAVFGGRNDEAGPWRAGPDDSAEQNVAAASRRAELNELDELDPDEMTPEQQARYGELEDAGTSDVVPSGYTARLDGPGVQRLRAELTAGLEKAGAVKVEEDAAWGEVERLEAEYQRVHEIEKPLHAKVFAVWDAGGEPAPADVAEHGRLHDDFIAALDRYTEAKYDFEHDVSRGDPYDRSLTEGVIPGDWADVHYQVYYDDAEVHVYLAAMPHGSDREPFGYDDNASLEVGEALKVLRLLGRAIGDQSPTARQLAGQPRRDAAFEHLHARDEEGQFASVKGLLSGMIEKFGRLVDSRPVASGRVTLHQGGGIIMSRPGSGSDDRHVQSVSLDAQTARGLSDRLSDVETRADQWDEPEPAEPDTSELDSRSFDESEVELRLRADNSLAFHDEAGTERAVLANDEAIALREAMHRMMASGETDDGESLRDASVKGGSVDRDEDGFTITDEDGWTSEIPNEDVPDFMAALDEFVAEIQTHPERSHPPEFRPPDPDVPVEWTVEDGVGVGFLPDRTVRVAAVSESGEVGPTFDIRNSARFEVGDVRGALDDLAEMADSLDSDAKVEVDLDEVQLDLRNNGEIVFHDSSGDLLGIEENELAPLADTLDRFWQVDLPDEEGEDFDPDVVLRSEQILDGLTADLYADGRVWLNGGDVQIPAEAVDTARDGLREILSELDMYHGE